MVSLQKFTGCEHAWDPEFSFFSMRCRKCGVIISQQEIFVRGWKEAIWTGILNHIPALQRKMLKSTAPPDYLKIPGTRPVDGFR